MEMRTRLPAYKDNEKPSIEQKRTAINLTFGHNCVST